MQQDKSERSWMGQIWAPFPRMPSSSMVQQVSTHAWLWHSFVSSSWPCFSISNPPHRPFFCHHGSHTVCLNSKFSNLITSSWTWDWGVGLRFDGICHPIRLSTYLVRGGLIHTACEILWAKMKVYYRLSGLFCLRGSNAIGQEFPSYITTVLLAW
jgi:hypothetical protein